MLENGFVKLHRSMLKWEWYDDLNTARLFIHLLLTVSIKDDNWHGDLIKRGERVFSRAVLVRELNISEQSVKTALNHLKSTGEITIRKMPKYSVITVNNFDVFQEVTGKSTRKQLIGNQVSTGYPPQYKKIEEDQEDKERERAPSERTADELRALKMAMRE